MASNIRPYVSKRLKKELTQKSETAGANAGTVSDKGKCEVQWSESRAVDSRSRVNDTGFKYHKNHVPQKCISKHKEHRNAVNCIRWNSKQTDLLLSASMDSSIGLWNWKTKGVERMLTVHSSAVKDARWNKSGEKILSGGYDKEAKITDVEKGQELRSFKHKDFVTCTLYHPSQDDIFLTGTSRSGIFAWDTRTDKPIHHYKSFFGQVQDLVFLPNGETFLSAAEVLSKNSMDKAVVAWDFDSTAILSNQICQESFNYTCLQVHPKDQVVLAQSGAGYIVIISCDPPYKLNKYKRYEGHQSAGFHIGFTISPDGNLIVTGDTDGRVFVYDYRSSNILRVFNEHSSVCMDVAFHPDLSSVIATCCWDGSVAFFQ